MLERVELHAHRRTFGSPTIHTIATHWDKEYGIKMHYQSEKEWALKNKQQIDECIRTKISTGEWTPPSITNGSLSNTLVHGAESKVDVIKLLKLRMSNLLKADFDKKTTDEKKDIVSIVKGLASTSKWESEQLVEFIREAGKLNMEKEAQRLLIEGEAQKLSNKNDKRNNEADIQADEAEIIEIDNIEDVRKAAGIE